jgi:hypothetical protein
MEQHNLPIAPSAFHDFANPQYQPQYLRRQQERANPAWASRAGDPWTVAQLTRLEFQATIVYALKLRL